MALGFHVQCFLHRCAAHQYGHVAVQHVHLFLCVCDHRASRPDARHADDDTPRKKGGADDTYQLDLVFQILDDHTLPVFVFQFIYILTVKHDHHRLV